MVLLPLLSILVFQLGLMLYVSTGRKVNFVIASQLLTLLMIVSLLLYNILLISQRSIYAAG